jgi:hypothetical protein
MSSSIPSLTFELHFNSAEYKDYCNIVHLRAGLNALTIMYSNCVYPAETMIAADVSNLRDKLREEIKREEVHLAAQITSVKERYNEILAWIQKHSAEDAIVFAHCSFPPKDS